MHIFHQESDFIVLDKAPGVGVQSMRSKQIPNLVDLWASENGGEILRPAHRLDVRASGLVVLARTQLAASRLSALFQEKRVGKSYEVRLWGQLPMAEVGPIEVSEALTKRNGRAWIDENGKQSVSIFEALDFREGCTDAKVITKTGRFHQVRAHSAFLGCPVLGDVRYGGPQADRLFLHASTLAFEHPRSGKPLVFSSAAPWMD